MQSDNRMQKMTLQRGVRSVALVGALAAGVFGVQREPVVSGQEPTVRSWAVSAKPVQVTARSESKSLKTTW